MCFVKESLKFIHILVFNSQNKQLITERNNKLSKANIPRHTVTFSGHNIIINLTLSFSYFQLQCLSAIHRSASTYTLTSIIHAFVCSRFDYCNSLLLGLYKVSLSPIQSVLSADTRLRPIAHLPKLKVLPHVQYSLNSCPSF